MTDDRERARLAARAARVHALSDPLGAKGFRRPAARLERERRARRTVFGAVFATFVAFFWLVAGGRRPPAPPPPPPAPVSAAAPAAADVPVTGSDGQVTIYRYVEQPAHVVTRSS